MIVRVCMYCRTPYGWEQDGKPEHMYSHGLCWREACMREFSRRYLMPLDELREARRGAGVPTCQKDLC
jgi:hypothetical protein